MARRAGGRFPVRLVFHTLARLRFPTLSSQRASKSLESNPSPVVNRTSTNALPTPPLTRSGERTPVSFSPLPIPVLPTPPSTPSSNGIPIALNSPSHASDVSGHHSPSSTRSEIPRGSSSSNVPRLSVTPEERELFQGIAMPNFNPETSGTPKRIKVLGMIKKLFHYEHNVSVYNFHSSSGDYIALDEGGRANVCTYGAFQPSCQCDIRKAL